MKKVHDNPIYMSQNNALSPEWLHYIKGASEISGLQWVHIKLAYLNIYVLALVTVGLALKELNIENVSANKKSSILRETILIPFKLT